MPKDPELPAWATQVRDITDVLVEVQRRYGQGGLAGVLSEMDEDHLRFCLHRAIGRLADA